MYTRVSPVAATRTVSGTFHSAFGGSFTRDGRWRETRRLTRASKAAPPPPRASPCGEAARRRPQQVAIAAGRDVGDRLPVFRRPAIVGRQRGRRGTRGADAPARGCRRAHHLPERVRAEEFLLEAYNKDAKQQNKLCVPRSANIGIKALCVCAPWYLHAACKPSIGEEHTEPRSTRRPRPITRRRWRLRRTTLCQSR